MLLFHDVYIHQCHKDMYMHSLYKLTAFVTVCYEGRAKRLQCKAKSCKIFIGGMCSLVPTIGLL